MQFKLMPTIEILIRDQELTLEIVETRTDHTTKPVCFESLRKSRGMVHTYPEAGSSTSKRKGMHITSYAQYQTDLPLDSANY